MIVYRFEYANKKGPFCYYKGKKDAKIYNEETRLNDDCYDPPGPFDECKSSSLYKHYKDNGLGIFIFGFSSKNSLKNWFKCSYGRQAMKSEISVYEVPNEYVFRGEWQVVFHPLEARLVGKLCKKTLKNLPL